MIKNQITYHKRIHSRRIYCRSFSTIKDLDGDSFFFTYRLSCFSEIDKGVLRSV